VNVTEHRYFVDGRAVAANNFVVRADDDGLLRGLAVFETLRTHNGRLFRASQHMARLVDSAALMEVPSPNLPSLLSEIQDAVAGYPVDAMVRITLTMAGKRLLWVSPLQQSLVQGSVRVATLSWELPPWFSGRIKHCSRALNHVARTQAGVDEIFWVGADGYFTEGTRSNIFAVIDGVLVTPPDDGRLLCGVTRRAILELSSAAEITVEEASIRPGDKYTELYSSSTLRNLAPVVQLNDQAAPGHGPIGERMGQLLEELMAKECSA
jgi:branched-subunit amino acid aminotransferase/4-amino-4-deoxychorismate lyase